MASGNKIPYVIEVALQGDIARSRQAMQDLSKVLNTAFTTRTNTGQSVAADLRDIETVLGRIQNSASKPIRGNWGMDTLISDSELATGKIEELIQKLQNFRDFGDKKERFKLIDEQQLNAFNTLNDKVNEYKDNLKSLSSIQDKYNKKLEEINSIKNKANSNDKVNQLMGFSKNRPEGRKYKEPEGGFDSVINSANEDIVAILNNYKKGSKIKNYLGASESKQKQWENSYIKEAQKRQSEYSQEIIKLTEKQQLGIITDTEVKQLDEYREKIGKVSLEIQELEKLKEKARIASYKKGHNAEIDRINEEVKARQKEADELKKILEDRNTLFNNQGEVVDFQLTEEQIASLEPIFEKLGITVSDTGMKYSELQNAVAQADQELDKESREIIDGVVVGLNEQARAQREVTNETKKGVEVNKEQNEQLSKIEGIKNRIAMFTGFYGALNLTRRAVRQAITTIKELDEQMTQMAVVTSSTISDYWKQLPEYTRRANEFGMAIKDVYAADTLYYQQGLKTQQVIEVSNETLKLARIAALDTAEATDRLTAAMRGFSMVVGQESAERVNDVFSKLAAITASNVEEISKAMTKTASIAHSAGMEFETTAAFLSQIIETTRESAETAGTAMKTVIARFGELKKAPSEIGEVEGEIVDANKIETALRSVGIALRDAQGQFRDLDDVFLELSAKWGGLDKNTQRYIATIAAGSRQQSRFIAMMQNYSRTMELVSAANNSAGTSTEQFAKTMDSLKNKLNGLKNAWDTFTMGILQSDVFKYLVDSGTTILNIINQIFKTVDKIADAINLPIIGAITRLGALIGLMYGLKKVINGYVIPGIQKLIVTKKVENKTTEEGAGAIAAETGALATHAKMVEADTAAIVANNAARSQGVGARIASSFSTAGSNIAAGITTGATTVASGFSKVLTTIGTTLSSIISKLIAAIPYILIIGAGVAAILAAINLIKSAIGSIKYNSQEEKFKRDKEALEGYKKAIDETKKSLDELNTAQDNYNSLVEELNKLSVGSSEWRNQLQKVNSEVLDLVKKYKELAKYTSRDNLTGQLSIKEEGFTQVKNSKNKDLLSLQRLELMQMRKVYKNEAKEREDEYIDKYKSLGEKLNKYSLETLQSTLLDTDALATLANTYDKSITTIQSAIQELISNKEAMELNSEQLNILTQSMASEDENEVIPQIIYEAELNSRVTTKAIQDFANALHEGAEYEDNEKYQEIAKELGINENEYKGKSDKEALAGLLGALEGKTFQEGIELYSDAAKAAIWGGNRKDIEKTVSELYLRRKTSKELLEDWNNNRVTYTKKYSKAEEAFFSKDFSSLSTDEIKSLKLNSEDVTLAVENGVIDSKYVTPMVDNPLDITKILEGILDTSQWGKFSNIYYSKLEEGKNYTVEEMEKLIAKVYEEAYGTGTPGEKLWENLPEDRKAAILSGIQSSTYAVDIKEVAKDIDEQLYSKYFKTSLGDVTGISALKESFTQIQNGTEQALLDRIQQIWLRGGKKSSTLGTFSTLYDDLIGENSAKNEEKIAEILNLYDWTNSRDLDKMGEQLKQTGLIEDSVIDNFIKQLKDLANAVDNVSFDDIVNGLNLMSKTFKEIREGTFGGTFDQDTYDKIISSFGGRFFNREEFVKTDNGFKFKGTNKQLMKKMSSTFGAGLPLEEYLNTVEEQIGVFSEIKETKDINLNTGKALKESLMKYLEGKSQEDIDRIVKYLNLEGLYNATEVEDLNLDEVKAFFENWILKQEDNKELLAHWEEYLKQIIGAIQTNAYKLVNNGYNEELADSVFGAFDSEVVSEASLNRWIELREIMKQGGEQAKEYEEEWKQLTTDLANASGLNRAVKNMQTSASKMKEALDGIGDSAVDTESELNELNETASHLHIKTIEHENYKMGEAYRSLFALIGQENEEAYLTLIQLIASSNGYFGDIYNELMKKDSLQNEKLKELAQLFENLGFGHINAELNNLDWFSVKNFADQMNGKDNKDKDKNPWENPYDWLWNINEAINKQIYLRERLERKYKMAVEDSTKATQDLYEISEKELANLKYQAELEKVKGENARTELKMLMDEYKNYAKYVSVNQATGQVQVDYEALNKVGWDSDRGSAFESFVSRISELAETSKDSITALEDIYDQVKEIRDRGREQYLALENRVKEDLIKERQAEIDSISAINESIQKAQNDMLESMREQIDETRRIRENTDKQKDIEEKRQRLAYLQRDTSGANQVEILTLQEEINKDELSYADTLVDQSLQNIQTENEKAAEARQQQIDIMNFQLKVWEESGEIWNSVEALMNGYFEGGKAMTELIKKQENWVGLSRLQKENFESELTEQGKLAQLFHENNLHDDASELLTEIEATTNSLNKLYDNGAIGNVKLDDGKWVPVTLHDYNPKEVDNNSIASAALTLSEILELLSNYFDLNKKVPDASPNKVDWISSIGEGLYYQGKDYDDLIGAVSSFKGKIKELNQLTESQLAALVTVLRNAGWNINDSRVKNFDYTKYATGGLTTQTGPAWLDGTPSNPEYVLNPQQTRAFFNLVDSIVALGSGTNNLPSGDNYFDININVDELASDYDVDQLADRIRQTILEDSQYRNVNFVAALR